MASSSQNLIWKTAAPVTFLAVANGACLTSAWKH